MDDLEFPITILQKDALAGEVVAHRADDTRVVVHLKRQTDNVTEIRIRVGTFGDESLSRLVNDKIKAHF